ncbi:MAG: ribbon-helix-helix protein, CopG family [Acidobacteriota bacterium]
MHRTQVSLREDQYRQLLETSRRLGISLAELIRRLADEYLLKQEGEDPFENLAGLGQGSGEPVGRHHDRYLYGETE